MMLAYSSKCYSVTVVDIVEIFRSHIMNMQILDLPKHLVSMAMFFTIYVLGVL